MYPRLGTSALDIAMSLLANI